MSFSCSFDYTFVFDGVMGSFMTSDSTTSRLQEMFEDIKGYSEEVNRRRTDNTMVKRKRDNKTNDDL